MSKVVSLDEINTHPQVVANGAVVKARHEHLGPIHYARAAPRFDGDPSPFVVAAPTIGQHIDESLGLDARELAAHRDDGVIR